jgi:hypothetical protein
VSCPVPGLGHLGNSMPKSRVHDDAMSRICRAAVLRAGAVGNACQTLSEVRSVVVGFETAVSWRDSWRRFARHTGWPLSWNYESNGPTGDLVTGWCGPSSVGLGPRRRGGRLTVSFWAAPPGDCQFVILRERGRHHGSECLGQDRCWDGAKFRGVRGRPRGVAGRIVTCRTPWAGEERRRRNGLVPVVQGSLALVVEQLRVPGAWMTSGRVE